LAERGITLNVTSGARVALLEEEATWLRDELLGGEYTSPKRDADIVVDRALTALDKNAEPSPAEMTPATVVELAWALRGMLERDPDRFIGSPLLMHLLDLLFIELERGREDGRDGERSLWEAENMEKERPGGDRAGGIPVPGRRRRIRLGREQPLEVGVRLGLRVAVDRALS
jgi:hypothetical protein